MSSQFPRRGDAHFRCTVYGYHKNSNQSRKAKEQELRKWTRDQDLQPPEEEAAPDKIGQAWIFKLSLHCPSKRPRPAASKWARHAKTWILQLRIIERKAFWYSLVDSPLCFLPNVSWRLFCCSIEGRMLRLANFFIWKVIRAHSWAHHQKKKKWKYAPQWCKRGPAPWALHVLALADVPTCNQCWEDR